MRRSTPSPTSRRSHGLRSQSTSSRRGSGPSSALFAAYDHCAEQGIGAYGGGQFELGAGRGHIQLLAALFHPGTPNDVAPGGFNEVAPRPVSRRARSRSCRARTGFLAETVD